MGKHRVCANICCATSIAQSEDLPARFHAAHWPVLEVDRHDPEALDVTLALAKRRLLDRLHEGLQPEGWQDRLRAHATRAAEAGLAQPGCKIYAGALCLYA
ncbi:MAG: hypothetical protein K5Q68_11655 [Roseococcus sp.]|nr:hypothetical protein [Roseococcus sp.]